MTCEECRWKTERGECPWNYDYRGTDYAEDCDDFRYIKFQETAFKESYLPEAKTTQTQATHPRRAIWEEYE